MLRDASVFQESFKKDKKTNWDRSHYDFGHYGGHGLENHKNWKARYCRL